MRGLYQTVSRAETKKIVEYLAKECQHLLPMVELIDGARIVIDELIDVLGRASIEAVLTLSAHSIAGAKHQGRRGGEIRWHGYQRGVVSLSDRKLCVHKPRLRKRNKGNGGEVEIPAYVTMRADDALKMRILEVLMRGVSTRNYKHIISEMADTAGVSRSSVSRRFVEESASALRTLVERRFDEVELLVIYIDGLVFGDVHIIAAVGVDTGGKKHVLGIVEGASENAASAVSLLESLVERGVDPLRRYLFVIDGSKALRAAIDKVFGSNNPVQRCRNHKVKNVCDKLPDELKEQVKSVMKAAYRLPHAEGIARLKKQAEWLAAHYPDAAKSLLEGLDETFTINRLELSASLKRCLGTTNIIESPCAGVRLKTRRVCHFKDGMMALRWAASAFLDTEKSFKRINGYKDLWMLKTKLEDETLDIKKEVA